MESDRLAGLVTTLNRFEREVRDVLNDRTGSVEEITHAHAALRQTIALRGPLERWLTARACQAAARAS